MIETAREGMVRIEGGTFRMGSDRFYPEEAPVRDVSVDGFWIDAYAVTQRANFRSSSARPVTSRSPRGR